MGARAAGGDLSRLKRDFNERRRSESPFVSVTAATALAFFAMVGFEDSVNMAEETKDPVRIFPKVMLAGLSITGLIYLLVSISSVALVSPDDLGEGDAPLLKGGGRRAGVPGQHLRLHHDVRGGELGAHQHAHGIRLLYGMAQRAVTCSGPGHGAPGRRTPWAGSCSPRSIAFGLIWFADLTALGGTTALLLLCVFTVVNRGQVLRDCGPSLKAPIFLGRAPIAPAAHRRDRTARTLAARSFDRVSACRSPTPSRASTSTSAMPVDWSHPSGG